MVWIIVCASILYVVANAPLFYSLRYVHKISGTSLLWGHAPNQFFFLVVIYPFALLATLSALHSFAFRLLPTLPGDLRLRVVFDNWPVAILIGFIVAAFFAIIVYFTSSWSFDKLKPLYAKTSLEAVRQIDSQVRNFSYKRDEQQEYRNRLTGNAKDNFSKLDVPTVNDKAIIDTWLLSLEPETYLQVTQHSKLALRLRLFEPVIHALNVFQLFSTLFVAFCTLSLIAFCFYCAQAVNYDFKSYPELTNTMNALFWAVFFFGLYSICYHQHRVQIEEVVGTGSTVMQDVFVGVIVVAMLLCLRVIDPANREVSFDTVLKYSPVLLFGGGSIFGVFTPQLTKQVIGSDANLGVHVITSLLVFLAACFPVGHILFRR